MGKRIAAWIGLGLIAVMYLLTIVAAVMARPEAIDYVVIHELCHRKYMDHSKQFWNEVQKYMPNYFQEVLKKFYKRINLKIEENEKNK